ncbi:hypothetical protein R0K17_30725, partial [Planococcus sp. SIMBA_143]
FDLGVHINFAHQTCEWDNNGAHVHVVIIGFNITNSGDKFIYEYETITSEPIRRKVREINEYLVEAPPVLLTPRSSQIS